MTQVLSGRVVIVTGGGSGLGRAMSIGIGQAGGIAVVADVNPEHAAEVLAEAQTKGLADRLVYVPTDVTDPEACGAVVSETIARFGGAALAGSVMTNA